jgi:hypothetical protein
MKLMKSMKGSWTEFVSRAEFAKDWKAEFFSFQRNKKRLLSNVKTIATPFDGSQGLSKSNGVAGGRFLKSV